MRATSATVQRAEIQVKRRVHPATPSPPAFLPRWLLISADDAHVERATLSVYNGVRLEITSLTGAAVMRRRSIHFFQADGVLQGAHMSAIGELLAADPLGFQIKAHIDWHPDGQPAYILDGSARGDLNILNIVARTASPFRADITGQLRDLTSHLHFVGNAVVRDLQLSPWGVAGPFGSITGRLSITADLDGFHAQGLLNPRGLGAGDFEVLYDGGYANHVLTAKSAQARHVASGAQATATGTLAIVDHGPRLDLKGSWSEFRWPLAGRDPAVRSARGSYSLQGVLPYQVRVSGEFRAADLPLMPADVSGTLGKDGVAFDRAEIDLYGGHASASGRVTWAPQQTWDVSGHASTINPGALRPDLPGSLTFDFSTSGRGFDAKGAFSATFSNLSGKLRGATAGGSGTVRHAGKTWSFENLRASLGTANLALDGQIDERMNLRFAFTTQDLSLLAAGSRGQVKASGTLGGTLQEPSLVGVAHAANVDYAGVKLKGIDASIDFDPAVPAKESKIEAHLQGLSYQTRTLEAATLSLSGPPSAYVVHLSASAPGIAAKVQASGAYARGTFEGQLTALTLNGNDALHLTLDRPVGLIAAPDHVRLEWLCLVGTPGSVCADGEWKSAALVDDRHDQRAATRHAHRRQDALGAVPRHHRRAGAPQRRRRHPAAGQRAGITGGRGDRAPARQQANRAHPHRLRHGRRDAHADRDHRPGESRRRPGGHPAGQGCRAAHRAGVAEHAGDGRAARPECRARPRLPVRPGHRSRRRALQCGRADRRHHRHAGTLGPHQGDRRRAGRLPGQPLDARDRPRGARRRRRHRFQGQRHARARLGQCRRAHRVAQPAAVRQVPPAPAPTCGWRICPRRRSMPRRIWTSPSRAAGSR